MKYLREKDLGYEKEYVFTFPAYNMPFSTIKTELMQDPAIAGITGARDNIMNVGSKTSIPKWEGSVDGQNIMVAQLPIDTYFVRVMSLSLLSGNGFSPNATEGEAILNERAIAANGACGSCK
ncbi:MAG: hypothetical protein LBG19_09935 [Prevotellaceae bacterium]|jgi:putative ABC transport system permease protein|nr:hypothetical protein [Prevotellaceae bacterium]